MTIGNHLYNSLSSSTSEKANLLEISRKWDKFEADPTQFPRGLKATVTTIKQRFPHITHIAVWHAIFGYWDGVAPGGWVDQNYKCETLKWHGGWDVRVITAEDVGRCYDDFYRWVHWLTS